MAALTAHSRKRWRDKGWYVEGTESINRVPGGMVRRNDLFGFADLIAMPPNLGTGRPTLIQVTSRSNVASRVKKITMPGNTVGSGKWEMPVMLLAWMALNYFDIVVEGWDLKDNRWRCREVRIYFDMFGEIK